MSYGRCSRSGPGRVLVLAGKLHHVAYVIKLHHVAYVIRPGRYFVRRLMQLSKLHLNEH